MVIRIKKNRRLRHQPNCLSFNPLLLPRFDCDADWFLAAYTAHGNNRPKGQRSHFYYDGFFRVLSVPKTSKYSININERIYYMCRISLKRRVCYVNDLSLVCSGIFFSCLYMDRCLDFLTGMMDF